MKKIYANAEIEVIALNMEDILTTSPNKEFGGVDDDGVEL